MGHTAGRSKRFFGAERAKWRGLMQVSVAATKAHIGSDMVGKSRNRFHRLSCLRHPNHVISHSFAYARIVCFSALSP